VRGIDADEITLGEFARLMERRGDPLPERPSYQDLASALHAYVKATRRSTTILDAPPRAAGDDPRPMTVFSARDRRKTPAPVKWPSQDLKTIRAIEKQLGRKSKQKKRLRAELIEINRRKPDPEAD
jgi:hypothetical protein